MVDFDDNEIRGKVNSIYYLAAVFFLLPLISLALYALEIAPKNTEVYFLALFLVGMLPCGLISFGLSLIQYNRAKKKQDQFNINIGIAGFVLSGLMTVGGILTLIAVFMIAGVLG